MKKLGFLIIIFLTYNIGFSQDHSDDSIWEENYLEAASIAKKEHKKLLIFFTGSDWCGPCKKLVADFFDSDGFKKIAEEDLVLYEADFPRNKSLVTNEQWESNNRLSSKFKVNSFPTVLILDEKEKKIGQRKGYNMEDPSYYFKFVKRNIKK
jgi:thioredoxin-related protein